ncbi:MAG TPA: hypothetical protein VMH26_07900 [Burkholderiales bacterium]|nr:hypothetical protein [Burkholderiales bacterium]
MIRKIITAALLIGLQCVAYSGTSAPNEPRILLIGVDAVPYRVVAKLTAPGLGGRALFQGFKGPSAMISTFPSDTHVAWAGMLEPFGVKKSHGYQPRYFDNRTREVSGGLSLTETPAPWEAFFDWRLRGMITAAIAYGWPKKYSRDELRQGLDTFIQSGKRFFAMYIVSTDAIAHIYGPAALEEFLVDLDASLRALHRDHPEIPFYTVLISDHGVATGQPLRNTWPALREAMQQAGLRVSERLEGNNTVVFVPYGLLSSFVMHTAPGAAARAAKLAVAVPGVDLCVTPDPTGWRVQNSAGSALISKRQGSTEMLWSYRPQDGDPLRYAPVVARLRQRALGHVDGEWFSDASWFAATKDEFYPDGLYRLAGSLEAVENPASAVCSVAPGHMFGWLRTEYIARATVGRLKWTHGALFHDASLGFVLTDLPGWQAPDAARFNEALLPLADIVQRGIALH